MSSLMGTLRAYGELGRVSNLPTSFTNVLVGAAIGMTQNASLQYSEIWLRILLGWMAIACFYIAGMAMNDVVDAAIDRAERPNRPIPSGRISREAARRLIMVLIVIGLSVLAILGVGTFIAGVILVALIVAYNLLHTMTAASVVLMGLTRGMIYVIAALAMTDSIDWNLIALFGGAMMVYITALSAVARREMQSHIGRARWAAEALVFAAIIPSFFMDQMNWPSVVFFLMLATAWLSRGVGMVFASPPSTRQAVMTWLSGICLIDALYLASLEHDVWAIIASACFIITALAQRRVMGT